MNSDEFVKALEKIDVELSDKINAGDFTPRLGSIYREKYQLLIIEALNIRDSGVVNFLSNRCYQVIVFSLSLGKSQQLLNEKAIPAFNIQSTVNTSLRNAISKIGSQLEKVRQDRKKGAKTLHAETEEMRLEILELYKLNKTKFNSKDEAAYYYTSLYPLKFSTIRNYLKNK
ncbi:hypothetical protein [Methylotenera sp. N17]|uniref:hypothetical protein n=1 Tax=Methylotenera sp. N17 TaxID=1502761 RepID=UPI000646BBDE|nr:hypothetical protein [Methylotenera sp. N17]